MFKGSESVQRPMLTLHFSCRYRMSCWKKNMLPEPKHGLGVGTPRGFRLSCVIIQMKRTLHILLYNTPLEPRYTLPIVQFLRQEGFSADLFEPPRSPLLLSFQDFRWLKYANYTHMSYLLLLFLDSLAFPLTLDASVS
jgi:hypothetical protein